MDRNNSGSWRLLFFPSLPRVCDGRREIRTGWPVGRGIFGTGSPTTCWRRLVAFGSFFLGGWISNLKKVEFLIMVVGLQGAWMLYLGRERRVVGWDVFRFIFN